MPPELARGPLSPSWARPSVPRLSAEPSTPSSPVSAVGGDRRGTSARRAVPFRPLGRQTEVVLAKEPDGIRSPSARVRAPLKKSRPPSRRNEISRRNCGPDAARQPSSRLSPVPDGGGDEISTENLDPAGGQTSSSGVSSRPPPRENEISTDNRVLPRGWTGWSERNPDMTMRRNLFFARKRRPLGPFRPSDRGPFLGPRRRAPISREKPPRTLRGGRHPLTPRPLPGRPPHHDSPARPGRGSRTARKAEDKATRPGTKPRLDFRGGLFTFGARTSGLCFFEGFERGRRWRTMTSTDAK